MKSDATSVHNAIACQICGQTGHSALGCPQRANIAYQGTEPPASHTALTAKANFQTAGHNNQFTRPATEFSEYDAWIGDSGASHHMTADFSKLINAQAYTQDG